MPLEVGDPALGEVSAVTADAQIGVNIKGDIFKWDWTDPAGDTPALIDERQVVNFSTTLSYFILFRWANCLS